MEESGTSLRRCPEAPRGGPAFWFARELAGQRRPRGHGWRGRVMVAAALAASLGPATAGANDRLEIKVVGRSSPVVVGGGATVEIQTAPGAECGIRVQYESGRSRAKGLAPQVADGRGRIRWSWRIAPGTSPGKWPINVSCAAGGRRGSLGVWFVVRAKPPA